MTENKRGRRAQAWFIAVAALALAAAAYWQWMQPRQNAANVETQDSLAQPQTEAPLDATSEPSDARRPAPPRIRSEPPQSRAERFLGYETLYRNDAPDPAWSVKAEKDLMDAASEPALTQFGVPEKYQAQCMGRLCKIDMEFATSAQANDWAELYVVETGGVLTSVQTQITSLPGGRAGLTLFGTRSGSEALLRNSSVQPTPSQPDRNHNR